MLDRIFYKEYITSIETNPDGRKMQNLENHMVIPQPVIVDRVPVRSNDEIIEDVALNIDVNDINRDQLAGVAEYLVDEPQFLNMLMCAISANPETSQRQCAQLRQYVYDKWLANEVNAQGGDLEAELEVADVMPEFYTEKERASLDGMFGDPVSQLRDLGVM